MLCERNDDVTFYALFTTCTAECTTTVYIACRCSVKVAFALLGKLACIPEPEVGRYRRFVQRKGHTVGLLLV